MLNMHRPSDQAKLLFFALLRGTVSALATESKAATGVASLAVKSSFSPPPCMPSNIQLRLARRADVASIQRCNLATLPENYNAQFYANHLRQWPDLCLVAEDTMTADDDNHHRHHHNNNNNEELRQDGRLMGSSFSLGGGNGKAEPNVVAYVLGKVEQRPPPMPSGYYMDNHQFGGGPTTTNGQGPADYEDRFIGHVTSLAVLQPYRRKGLANALMKQLHFHLEEAYGAGAVGLHVRKSNQAACRLYQEFGYQIDLTIPGYYQDGEDAYFMKKTLRQTAGAGTMKSESSPKFPFLGRRPARPWEAGPLDLRLPRSLEEPVPSTVPQSQRMGHGHGQPHSSPVTTRDDEHQNGLFTGIM